MKRPKCPKSMRARSFLLPPVRLSPTPLTGALPPRQQPGRPPASPSLASRPPLDEDALTAPPPPFFPTEASSSSYSYYWARGLVVPPPPTTASLPGDDHPWSSTALSPPPPPAAGTVLPAPLRISPEREREREGHRSKKLAAAASSAGAKCARKAAASSNSTTGRLGAPRRPFPFLLFPPRGVCGGGPTPCARGGGRSVVVVGGVRERERASAPASLAFFSPPRARPLLVLFSCLDEREILGSDMGCSSRWERLRRRCPC